VQFSVTRTPAADDVVLKKMHRYLEDNMITGLLNGEYRPWNNNDQFQALFTVPTLGLDVSAP
jgi:hypothetical protein